MTQAQQRIAISRPRMRSTRTVTGMPDGRRGHLPANGLFSGMHEAGQEVAVTMMFLDVRNFTHLTRDRCPHQVVEALNSLFGLAAPVIAAHGGHIDKFMGDGLMAVFGMSREDAGHADRALAAALAIDARVGEKLHGWIDIGIGLDSGTVLVAILGGGEKLDVTLIGHAVNMAAHVEAATRRTNDTILLTERTRNLLETEQNLEARLLPVSGEADPALLYAPPASRVRAEAGFSLCREAS